MIDCKIEELIGKTIINIVGKEGDDQIKFTTSDGDKYWMFHSQDCCESVSIDDIVGDLSDIVGSPIINAEEVTDRENNNKQNNDSFTWTFYKIFTEKGDVNIRWYGSSNGYYSESVSFCRESKDE